MKFCNIITDDLSKLGINSIEKEANPIKEAARAAGAVPEHNSTILKLN
jgi:hypothetical protein